MFRFEPESWERSGPLANAVTGQNDNTHTRNDPKRDNDELELTARYRRNDSSSDPRHFQEQWSLNVVVVAIGGWACNSTHDN